MAHTASDDVAVDNSELEQSEFKTFCQFLIKAFPYMRNDLAHGSSTLAPWPSMSFSICCDLINQLFEPKSDVLEKSTT